MQKHTVMITSFNFIKQMSQTILLLLMCSFLPLNAHATSSPPVKNKYWEAYFKSKLRDPPAGFVVTALNALQQSNPPGRKVAIDLGCGVGHETLELLKKGYHVVAIDGQPQAFDYMKQLPMMHQYEGNLKTVVSSFEKLNFAELPEADMIVASFALPFMKANDFNRVWTEVKGKIKPGGYFVGNFFDPDDSFFAQKFRSSMTFHNKVQAMALFHGFQIVGFQEVNTPASKPGTMNHYYAFVGKKL
ncbi:MAG: class I SAM-dependent methyltransferase [Candidatus Berkiella sp.]